MDGLADAVEAGVDLESLGVAANRFGDVAEVGVAVAFAGPCTEVTGHSFDGFAAVENGVFEFFAEIVDDRTLVKGFCEGGVEFDGVAEMFAGTGEVAFLQSHRAAGEAAVGFFAASAKPD